MTAVPRSRIAAGALIAAAIAAVGGGLYVLGSPGEERIRRLDDRRIEDLSGIARAVEVYWSRHDRLPASLDELQKEPVGDVEYKDPETNKSYEYRPLEAREFELCAEFARDSQGSQRAA